MPVANGAHRGRVTVTPDARRGRFLLDAENLPPIVGGRGRLATWDADAGTRIWAEAASIWDPVGRLGQQFLDDNRLGWLEDYDAETETGTLVLADYDSGQVLHRAPGVTHSVRYFMSAVGAAYFRPDEEGGESLSLHWWDAEADEVRQIGAAVKADGFGHLGLRRRLSYLLADGDALRVFDTVTGRDRAVQDQVHHIFRVFRPGALAWFRGDGERDDPVPLYVWHIADERTVLVAERTSPWGSRAPSQAFGQRGIGFIETEGRVLRFYDVDANAVSEPLAADVRSMSGGAPGREHLVFFRVESEENPGRNGLYFASDR